MNKDMFFGWNGVFSFSIKQLCNQKYRATTFVIGCLLFIAGIAVFCLPAYFDVSDSESVSKVKAIHLVNETELAITEDLFRENAGEEFKNTALKLEDSSLKDVLSAIPSEEKEELVAVVSEKKKGFGVQVVLPYETDLDKGDAEDAGYALKKTLEKSKILSSDLSQEQIHYVNADIRTEIIEAGEEEKDPMQEAVSMLMPMVMMLGIYMMVLFYGMSVGNIVSVEKTSKLMEMLLTMTRPYSLIFGKVLAATTAAIMQVTIWLFSILLGMGAGNLITTNFISDSYENPITQLLTEASESGASGFGVPAVILAVVTLLIAFLFYFMLAGMAASFAEKSEEVSQSMSSFMMLMIFGFMLSYTIPIEGGSIAKTILRIVPFTAAYMLPGDILTGNIPVWQGGLYTLLLFVFTIVVTVLTGWVYKNQLFYKGKGIKDLFNKMKGKTKCKTQS